MFAGRLFAVRLLLADQRVQFAEMFFFLPFFCLEEEVHFSYDISSDRLTDVFFNSSLLDTTTSVNTSPIRERTCSS